MKKFLSFLAAACLLSLPGLVSQIENTPETRPGVQVDNEAQNGKALSTHLTS